MYNKKQLISFTTLLLIEQVICPKSKSARELIEELIEKNKKWKSFISFPKNELDALKDRLDNGKAIFTTRVKDERGEYFLGQLVDSSFGILQVKDIQSVYLKDHPFYAELSDKEKITLSKHKLDVVKLKQYKPRYSTGQ